MSEMGSLGSFEHLKHKLTANLTPDHKESGIDLFPMSDLGVQHGVEKLLTRATTLL
jgi:hypothetical protein